MTPRPADTARTRIAACGRRWTRPASTKPHVHAAAAAPVPRPRSGRGAGCTTTRRGAVTSWAVRLYHEDGLTCDQVARELDVRGSTVTRWLDGTARHRGRRKREDIDDAELVSLRDTDHLSWQEIAATIGMSRTGVRLRYGAIKGIPRPGRPPGQQARTREGGQQRPRRSGA